MQTNSSTQIFRVMKLFLYKIVIYLILLFIIDYGIGCAMSSIVPQITIGGTGRDNYICNQADDDILIFGSSRAMHHYNPSLLSDAFGLSCYNCGEGGCGIILAYGRLLMINERYTPKTIIYDITPNVDLTGNNYYKDLYRLKQHYDRAGIDSIFITIDPLEKYKMKCALYRNNTSYLRHLVAYFFNVSTDTGVRGFIPLKGKMDTMKIRKDNSFYALNDNNNYQKGDSLRLYYFNKFLDKAKDSEVIFVVSPVWYGQDTSQLQSIKDLAHARKVRFIDFSNETKYVHNNISFKDGRHLNSCGADEFTRDLIEAMK